MSSPICRSSGCLIPSGPFIRLDSLSLFYQDSCALGGIDLAIDACSVTAIIGPSGAGKSSLLSCFNRMCDLVEGCRITGKVYLGGKDIFAPETDTLTLRKKVGTIFQRPNPFPISIAKNITMPLKYHGIKNRGQRQELMEESLKDVGLWNEVKDRLHHRPERLSGGQQQRLCLARTLALKPDVILLDEPCSALDPIATAIVEEHILRLRSKVTQVIVTHNLAQAKRVADRIAVLWPVDGVGRLVEVGPTEQVFLDPQHQVTRDYLVGVAG